MAAALSNDISYESLLARTASYNRQLQLDKQSRLPFLDNATGIAQSPCLLHRKNEERYLSPLADKVFAYSPHKWKKTKRNTIAHSSVVRSAEQYNNNSRAADLLAGGNLAAQEAIWREIDDEDSRSTWTTNPVYEVDTEGSEIGDETYGGRRRKRKSRVPRSNKMNPSQLSTPSTGRRRAATNSYYANGNSIYEEDSNDKYPAPLFVCEICGGRYKTKSGINYHYNTQHAGHNGTNSPQPKKPVPQAGSVNNGNGTQSLPHTSVNTGLLSALIESTPDRGGSIYNSNLRNLPSTMLIHKG